MTSSSDFNTCFNSFVLTLCLWMILFTINRPTVTAAGLTCLNKAFLSCMPSTHASKVCFDRKHNTYNL